VLASSATGGAAEDFLATFRATRRGVIVGEASAGSPGDAASFALPRSWTVTLSVTHHAAPDGADLGGGVRPDIEVTQRVSDVLAGLDPPLERARDYVSGKRP
jgi:C-terminal processing protease CtpA/Prc